MAGLNATELATFYADYINSWNRRDLESYYSLYPRGFVDVESQAIAAENIERGTGVELRGALFLTLGPEGRIAEIAEYLDGGT